MEQSKEPLLKGSDDIDSHEIQPFVEGGRQLGLFEIIENPASSQRLSNTIELYDALPKYDWSQKRDYTLDQAEIVRSCQVRGQKYRVVIKAAIIERNGKNVLLFPGPREEMIEDALRKLAVSGHGRFINEHAGVAFSLYQLQMELQATGHTMSIDEIKEGLAICRGAVLEVYDDSSESMISSNFFPRMALTTRAEWTGKTGARCFVAFNELVTKSILELSFRQYNYQLGMSINSLLGRFIYKRMCHYWTQASANAPYTPSLVSFLEQSPRGLSERMPENVRAMKNALDALIKREVISTYEATPLKQGNKTIDVRYSILPHENFVRMVKASNHHKSRIALQNLKDQVG